MELSRKQVIEILEKADSTVYKEPKTITAQALEQAMADVRKMEVIEQIVNDRYGKPLFKFMDAIVKVVEDGNNNQHN